MTKRELERLRELVIKMMHHVEEVVSGERQFLAVLREASRHLGRVSREPGKWGVK